MPNLSIHVDDTTFQLVGRLAELQDRSKSWIVAAALKPYLEHHAWMLEETKRTLGDVEAGTAILHDHEAVAAAALARAAKLDQ